ETLNTTQRLQLVQQWQNFAYDAQPSATILYTKDIFAFDNTIRNAAYVFSTYHYPYWPPIEQLSMTSGSNTGSVILAQTGPAPSEGFNPVISSSYYDESVYGAIFSSLAQRNDTKFQSMIPQLASGWNVAPDQKTWTVSLRPGITWQDGVPFNATDVKFTFDALQDATLAGDQQSLVLGIVGGKSDVTIIDPYTVQFSLPAPYAYFIQNILTLPIIPAHILAGVPYSQWRTNSFNTGQGGPGPIGTGPYKFISYDPATGTNHLTRNNNYLDFPYNGKTALQSRGAFEVQDYYVTYISDSGAAIAALQSGSVNILDDQYDLSTQPNFLATWPSNQWVSYDGYGVQELGFNMQHPILGTGLGTPLGTADPSKATLAAKYVRQAISYAIPRDLIIQQVLNGYGNPGITTPVIGDYATGKAVTQGFTTTLAPYTFNLTKSRELLQEAGYFPTPAPHQSVWDTYGFMVTVILVASVLVVTGIYLDERRTLRAQSRAENFPAPTGPATSHATEPAESPTSQP
ncbi:MAG TPA: ABC transporter substrate-binding protein, partial [Candidatus Bathyarchaeia archaeon]|nr:ABC transporter substrate-binding protein [Candidatus Bathyarchaeia archaeon]